MSSSGIPSSNSLLLLSNRRKNFRKERSKEETLEKSGGIEEREGDRTEEPGIERRKVTKPRRWTADGPAFYVVEEAAL